jgi:hypothetical protein
MGVQHLEISSKLSVKQNIFNISVGFVRTPLVHQLENAFKQLLNGFEVAVHKRAVLQVKNAALRLENQRQKRKRVKSRTIVANGGILTVREGQDKVYGREIK